MKWTRDEMNRDEMNRDEMNRDEMNRDETAAMEHGPSKPSGHIFSLVEMVKEQRATATGMADAPFQLQNVAISSAVFLV